VLAPVTDGGDGEAGPTSDLDDPLAAVDPLEAGTVPASVGAGVEDPLAGPLELESPPPTESERPRPKPRRGPPPKKTKSGSSPVRLLVLLLIVLALLVAEWMGFVEIPWITPEGGRGPGAAGAAEPTPAGEMVSEAGEAPAAPPEDPNPIAAYVLAVASFTDLDDALERRNLLELVLPDVQFIVAPVEVEGSPYFRLLAGPAQDTLELLAIQDEMNQVLTQRVDGVIREANLAFLVGAQPRLNLAERFVDALDALGIPAHVLSYTEAGGAVWYRVYAGAYADASEASYLGRLLTEAGQSNFTLTERRGVQPE
jgi:hypothetical protein